MKVVAIIPARAGSKGVPEKNIKFLAGHPLIAFSIVAAKFCPQIERTIVSTDSEKIAEIAKAYGADVPFLRPADLARDNSTDIEFVQHALNWFQEYEGSSPELLLHLRPTTPLRDPKLIGAAITALRARPEATSMRSVHELPESPHKVFQIVGGFLTGFFPNDPRPEYYNLPRQSLPKAYHPNGYVDILKTSHIVGNGSLHGPRMLPFITPVAVEVDQPEDFEFLEFVIERHSHTLLKVLKPVQPPEL